MFCLSLCLSQRCLFYIYLTAQKSITQRRNQGDFTEIFNTVLQGIKLLTPNAPEALRKANIHLISILGTGEMAKILRALAALPWMLS